MSAVTSKVRLYDLAKELKIDTKRLIEEVRREGVDVSVPSNQISKQLADRIRGRYLTKRISASKEALNLTYKPFGSLMSSDITSESAVRHSTINPLKPLIPTAKTSTENRSAIPKKPAQQRSDARKKKRSAKRTKTCPVCSMSFESRKVMSTHVFKAHGYVLHGNRAVKPTWTILRQPEVAKPNSSNSLPHKSSHVETNHLFRANPI